MHCPNCEDEVLQPTLTRQGIEVDACGRCHGVWLERGAINHFFKHSSQFHSNFTAAMPFARAGAKFSPRHNQTRMLQVFYEDQFKIDYCPASNGLWFDSADLKSFNDNNKYFNLEPVWESDTEENNLIRQNALKHLPNLQIRLLSGLIGYFGMLWFGVYLLLLLAGVTNLVATSAASVIIGVKIFLAPLVVKLLVNRIYHVNWLKPGDIPGDQVGLVNLFIDKTCQWNNIRYPGIGIIDSEMPNIFSFGYTHNHAYIVLTSGLLEQLTDVELKTLIGFELGKIVNRDMTFVTQLQFLPFLNRLLVTRYRTNKHFIFDLLAYGHHVMDKILCWWQLAFLRVRVLHADRFTSINTNVNVLSEIIIRLNFQYLSVPSQSKQRPQDSYQHALGSLGLIQQLQATALAVMAYHEASSRSEVIEPERIVTALNWERSNTWAAWFEMWSVFPSIYTRMLYLQDYAEVNGMRPYLDFGTTMIEKKHDVFFLQFLLYILPYLTAILIPVYAIAFNAGAYSISITGVFGAIFMITGLCFLLRIILSYPEMEFSKLAISALTKNTNVSANRPIACKTDGMLLGRTVPGYIQAEEVFIKDSTGIMIVENNTRIVLENIPAINVVSKLLHDEANLGKRVTITGWYRRTPLPYIEIKTIELDNIMHANMVPYLKRGLFVIVVMLGVLIFLL